MGGFKQGCFSDRDGDPSSLLVNTDFASGCGHRRRKCCSGQGRCCRGGYEHRRRKRGDSALLGSGNDSLAPIDSKSWPRAHQDSSYMCASSMTTYFSRASATCIHGHKPENGRVQGIWLVNDIGTLRNVDPLECGRSPSNVGTDTFRKVNIY
jgi:hypothetical protein